MTETRQPYTVESTQAALETINRKLAEMRRQKRNLTAAIKAAEAERAWLEAELREVMAR